MDMVSLNNERALVVTSYKLVVDKTPLICMISTEDMVPLNETFLKDVVDCKTSLNHIEASSLNHIEASSLNHIETSSLNHIEASSLNKKAQVDNEHRKEQSDRK